MSFNEVLTYNTFISCIENQVIFNECVIYYRIKENEIYFEIYQRTG